MRYLNLFISALASCSIIVSCQKETPLPDTPPEPTVQQQEEEVVVFTATTDAHITKTELSDNGDDTYSVLWSSSDQIFINNCTLSIVTEDLPAGYGPGETKAQFTGTEPSPLGSSPLYKAFYPASLCSNMSVYNLPTEQEYVAGNVKEFPMYAESDTPALSFQNLCGIIRIGLKGDTRSISSIALSDASPSSPKGMSGRFTVVGGKAVISSGTAGTSLVCDTPVALNTDTFTYFWITVPAASYGKLRIVINASDGYSWTVTSKNAITVERSMITPIELSSPKFKNDKVQIYYTTTDGEKISKYDVGASATVFGTGLVVDAHSYTGGVGTITLSGTVTTIGNNAFQNCTTLSSIEIPSTVTAINSGAFWGCSALTSVDLPSGLTFIGPSAFRNTGLTDLPSGLKDGMAIREHAFRGTQLTSIVFPDELTSLGTTYASIFADCASLTSVDLNKITVIPNYCFDGCSALTTIDLSEVTSIREGAFRETALSSASLPLITDVPAAAFSGCTSLISINLPLVETIGNQAFNGCSSLTSVSLPAATTIRDQAFYSNSELTSVYLPLVQTITANAFRYCPKLTSVNLPSIVSLSGSSFANCTTLATVDLGENLSAIQGGAFSTDPALTSIIIRATSVPSLTGASQLFNLGDPTIYVRSELIDSYKAATNWSAYSERFAAIP